MDAPNVGIDWTVRELVRWWGSTGSAARLASRVHVERRLARHVVAQLGDLRCFDLTADAIEQHLVQRELAGLGAEAINKVRSDLRRCIRAAKGARRWPWDDPTEYVRPWPVARRSWRTLSADECRALLWGARPQHFVLFAAAIYAGLRKGELLALRVEDVDLTARRLYVRRSRRRDTTKTHRSRLLPISDELAMYLGLQLRALPAGCRFVFPGNGESGQRDMDAKLGRAARVALRAGGAEVRIRFQDLRHTCATLLRRAGVDRDLVAAVLGHVGKSATLIYTHFSEADLLNAVNRLALGAPRRLT